MANVSRRYVIRTGLAAGAAVAAARCSGAPKGTPNNPATGPEVNTNQIKDVTLRLIGTGVSQINEIRDKAQEDLGFKLEMRALSTEENNQIAITQPGQYDIFDGEYFSLPLVVPLAICNPLISRRFKPGIRSFPSLERVSTKGCPSNSRKEPPLTG
jgi:putative spermidine/putrescine transport system substrate-binding protein